MDFTQLPMNSTLIAPTPMHALIREQIVKERKGILGLRIVSLSQFISSFSYDEVPSIYEALFQAKKRIQPIKNQFTTYHKIADSALFLKECYRFCNDIRAWGIKDDFPCDSPAQKELHAILLNFQDITMPSDERQTIIELLHTLTFDNVYILDTYKTLEEQKIINLLLHHHAHLLNIEDNLQNKQFFHSVNKRQEVEACAQYILQHNLFAEDIHITLCDVSYQPLLKQIFERYQIPFTLLNEEHNSPISKRFIALLQFFLSPDSEQVIACFDAGLFIRKGMFSLREYMHVFSHDFFLPFEHVQQIMDGGNILNSHTLQDLKELESKAKELQEVLLPIFLEIKQMADYSSLLLHIANIVKESIQTQEDITMFARITSLLQDVHPYLEQADDIQFLISFLEDMKLQEDAKGFCGVQVHNLCSTMLDKQHHFMLGANQSMYPAFQTKKGIFDETYYASMQGYPTMEERYQFYQDQLLKLLNTTPTIVISYALGTYEGKSLECALEIEQFMSIESSPYPLHENYIEIVQNDTLDEQSARDLFLKDGILHGSISALERYVKCPYSYFLRYGLSLKEPMKLGFPDTYAGTLSHYILENLINTYGKEYTKHATDMISQILNEELSKLQQLFPSMKDALLNVKERIEESMIQTIAVLDDYEQHSSLSPSKCEVPFTYEIPLADAVLKLHGYIDRVDESKDFACILDYKSSIKTLSETNVFAALQLQLLTYSMVIAKESGKDIMGAYYISLKNETIPYPAGIMSRRKPVTHQINSREDMESERKKARRFNGWTMHKDIQFLDDDALHFVGLRANKEGEIKASKLYNLQTITTYFTKMYQNIGQKILTGNIALKPLEDACMFCDYHEICRFKGPFEDKVQQVETGEELYQKGEEEHA